MGEHIVTILDGMVAETYHFVRKSTRITSHVRRWYEWNLLMTILTIFHAVPYYTTAFRSPVTYSEYVIYYIKDRMRNSINQRASYTPRAATLGIHTKFT